MKTASVGEIQKNFAEVLRRIGDGDEIIVTKRGKAIAKILSIGPKKKINWPDFYTEAIRLKGESISDLIIKDREDRF